jgi:hypothetical protein
LKIVLTSSLPTERSAKWQAFYFFVLIIKKTPIVPNITLLAQAAMIGLRNPLCPMA